MDLFNEHLEQHRINCRTYETFREQHDLGVGAYDSKYLRGDQKRTFKKVRDDMNNSFALLKAAREQLPKRVSEEEADDRCPRCGLLDDGTHPVCPECGSDAEPTVLGTYEMNPKSEVRDGGGIFTVCPDCRHTFGWTM